MTTTSGTDEARWAEAQFLLDSMPTESAEQRLRRWRRLTLLFVCSVFVSGAVVGLVVALLIDGGGRSAADVPLWREIVGLGVIGVGFVLTVVGLVVQLKGNRRLRVWRNPLAPLTWVQRKQLGRQVRAGAVPTDRSRSPATSPSCWCTSGRRWRARSACC